MRCLKYILYPLLAISPIFPQASSISEKQAELLLVKDEIKQLENELKVKSLAEKKSFETIENLSKQAFLQNKVIGSLRNDIHLKQTEIEQTEIKIKIIENDIKMLADNYAAYVVALYKRGAYNELEALVDASSFQQAVLRLHYLQEFAEKRKRDLDKLKLKQAELEDTRSVLINEKKEKDNLVMEKEGEKKLLTKKISEKKAVLTSIRNDNKELKKLLAARKDSQRKIETLILAMVEAEKKKKEEIVKEESGIKEVKTKNSKTTGDKTGTLEYEFDTSTFTSFSALKGKMIWPLHKGKIIRKFGENKNKKLNTITLNYGIDIKSSGDKNVRCVGEGVVSAIDWLPGYGNIIIVSHKENFRTVYGHLSEIFVSEGDKVKGGTVLAKVDESIEGEILHFEIWQARDKQNPELWLAKK